MANPAPTRKRSSRILEFALILILAYLLTDIVGKWFFPDKDAPGAPKGIMIEMSDATIRSGGNAAVIVRNHTDKPFTVPSLCPQPPFAVYRIQGETKTPLTATGTALPCASAVTIEPDEEKEVELTPWKYSLFRQNATYEVSLKAASGSQIQGTGSVLSTRFEVYEPGAMVKLFRAFITKPFLNFLVFIASLLPDHNLGIGIVILTLLVKLLLFWPTQKSLEGQKKMQLLQPKLEAIKKQYSEDPQKLQSETMRVWKEHGVNPVQSCLPILLQFPILIGLFYVVQDSAVLATSRHLLYSFYSDLSWDFNPMFLGMDLTKANWIFPPLLVLLQYFQMKLTFQLASNKSKKEGKPEIDKAQQIQQQVMIYAMPLMIGFFAISFPAAVSLYWGVSTLFAIGQQMIVNREHLKV